MKTGAGATRREGEKEVKEEEGKVSVVNDESIEGGRKGYKK